MIPLLPLHFGALHPVEQWLALALAFGPFVVLAVVIVLRRRADSGDEEARAGVSDATTPRPSR
ncbi:MAG: hypothetical protein R2731_11980 [Nocardioides sp.]